ncbi:unnamed protein product [Discula destructiva]
MVPVGGSAFWVLGLLWSLGAVTLAFVLLRLYTRLMVVQSYGLDDDFFNAAFTMLIIYCVMITVAAQYGFGQELGAISNPADITKAILWEAIGQTVVVLAVWVSKTSLALFLLRLISSPRQRIAIMFPCILLGVAIVAALLSYWLDCRPIAFFWDRSIPGGECLEAGDYVSIVAGAISVFTDLWYAAFPWYMLWAVQMPPREKLFIQLSLSLGVLAAACGVERALQLKSLSSPEYLRDTAPLIIWHAAELAATMVCIGLPICRPLYKVWMDKIRRRAKIVDGSGEYSVHGVFAMHTIGGSTFNNRRQFTDEDEENPAIVLRSDLPLYPNQVVIKSVGRPRSSSPSQETMLGAEFRHENRPVAIPSADEHESQGTSSHGIRVTTTFGIRH